MVSAFTLELAWCSVNHLENSIIPCFTYLAFEDIKSYVLTGERSKLILRPPVRVVRPHKLQTVVSCRSQQLDEPSVIMSFVCPYLLNT